MWCRFVLRGLWSDLIPMPSKTGGSNWRSLCQVRCHDWQACGDMGLSQTCAGQLQSGVSQIRQSHSLDQHPESTLRPSEPEETIVPSYSIDMDLPDRSSRPEPEPLPLSHPLPTSKPNSAHPSDLNVDYGLFQDRSERVFAM
jgi:hypothetical protein